VVMLIVLLPTLAESLLGPSHRIGSLVEQMNW